MRIPDCNGGLGGWIFEYKPCDNTEPKAWKLAASQKIDTPLSVEEKRLWLNIMLGLEPDNDPTSKPADQIKAVDSNTLLQSRIEAKRASRTEMVARNSFGSKRDREEEAEEERLRKK